MKKYLPLIIMAITLIGCSQNNGYKGKKIQLNYVENGELQAVSPKHMFDEAFISKKDSLYYIGDDSCKACVSVKSQLENWCKEKHAVIYAIQVNDIDEQGFNYIVDSTVGYYGWNESSSVPTTYFFSEGVVVVAADEQNTMKMIDKYVEVKNG